MSLGDFNLKKNKRSFEYRYLALFSQLGLTVVSPIVVCVVVAVYVQDKWQTHDLLTVLLILLGVGCGMAGGLRLLLRTDKNKNEKKGDGGDGSKG